MKEVFVERLIYAFQILEIDIPFIFSVSLLYPLHQHIRRGLEEDGQIRRNDPLFQKMEQLLIEPKLTIVQISPRKDHVFIKEII